MSLVPPFAATAAYSLRRGSDTGARARRALHTYAAPEKTIVMKRSTRSPKATRRKFAALKSPAKAAIRRGTTWLEAEMPPRVESRMAPPRYAERRHARPGAGIKRSRANMTPRSRGKRAGA
jgi:hypothetical protein